MENNSNLVITIITILIVNSGLILPSSAADGLIVINNITPFASPYGTISVNATSLDDIDSLPLYHGSFGENGSINLQLQQIGKERQNVTPASEAPAVAQKALEEYGGLPQDAVLNGASTTYSEIYNYTLHTTTDKEPMFTTVSYSREIDGFWVYGDSNAIILTLGENGDLLWLFKVWRDYSYTGDAKLIPIYTALEKLKRGEVLDEPIISGEKITIDIALPDYYAKDIGNNETVLEPIWMLVGTTESGSRVGFYVYARQFANFTATPVIASTGDIISFTDTSDASPVKWYWDFGDGTNSTLRNPTHAYATGGNYTITHTVWNDLGSDTLSRTEYITIYPDPKPVAGYTSNYSWENQVPPLTVVFNDTSAGTIINWSWDFGDGTNSTEQNPTHVFTLLPDTISRGFTVNLTVTDMYGRNSSYINYINLYKGFIPNFTASPTTGPAPLNVIFTDVSEDHTHPIAIGWNFGDGEGQYFWESPYPITISHTYTNEGIYNVTLTYFGPFEDSFDTTKEFYVSVQNKSLLPVTDFYANSTSGNEPLSVAFTDTSLESPTTWAWDFGDGLISANQNPVHTYTSAGNYSVSLTATNTYGSNATTKTDYIIVLPLVMPDANFIASPLSGKNPLTVTFNDTTTGSPSAWLWDFGDGTSSAEQHPVHQYTAAGNYSISLTVTNNDGNDTEDRPDYITVISLTLPVADFTVNTTSGQVPFAIEFNDTSTGSPTGWSWTFGDGGTSAEQNPVHVYTSTGQFTVSLEVTNEDGSNTTTKEQYITGNTLILPVAEFTTNTTYGDAPLSVGFTDQSTGSPASWHWSFGDSATSDEQNPSHLYTDAGTYTVSLEVTNPDGSNTATKTDYISVTSTTRPPVADFKGKPTCGKSPLTVKFNDTSSGSPNSWIWDFGDGTSATEQNPVHVYTTAGKYTVSLTATNTGGSNTSIRRNYITVSGTGSKPPVANFYSKPTSGKAPLSAKFTDTSTGNPATWYWEFGDGTNATERNPVHSYTSSGKYTVSLTVTNGAGSDTKTRTEYITVKGTPPPSADFYGKPTSGKAPLIVRFTDRSTGSPTSWSWDFGDGTTATDKNPVHTYTSAGKYTVSLTAFNAGGKTTRTRTRYITVSGIGPTPTPTHTCTTKPTTICTQSQCEPHTVPEVTGTTENGKVRLDWNVIANPCLQGYKVVISKNNPAPAYPDDGYMLWITDRNRNYAVISSTDHYNGGDFGGYLQPGESYYFSITAVYSDTKVAGNALELDYPI